MNDDCDVYSVLGIERGWKDLNCAWEVLAKPRTVAGRQQPSRVMLLYEDKVSNGCQEPPLVRQARSVTASAAHVHA